MTQSESKTILVVEDDPDVMFAITDLLKLEGYQVLTATNGFEALALLKARGVPDLILLDMKMPVMNGWEFAAEFNARHDHEAPIVVMTAAADAEKRAADIRADGWISKPFKLEALIVAIEKHMRGRNGTHFIRSD